MMYNATSGRRDRLPRTFERLAPINLNLQEPLSTRATHHLPAGTTLNPQFESNAPPLSHHGHAHLTAAAQPAIPAPPNRQQPPPLHSQPSQQEHTRCAASNSLRPGRPNLPHPDRPPNVQAREQDHLMGPTLQSLLAELQELGIEPARQRRYLIRKREKFRNGIYGPGGDLETVVDGVAQLRVVEVPREALPSATSAEAVAGDSESAIAQSKPLASAAVTPGMKRAIVNLLPGVTEYKHEPNTVLKKFLGMKIHRGSQIKGPYLLPVRGSHGRAATISVQEGMWEDKRGHKIDGGERRQREVRAKKELEERRKRA
ncbi:hypothetical protein N7468_005357 [Penicillium chermesinum]|uniref:Small ribosomal subunit protein mS41 n=1 Tax=Penicillium chermesinum TaxID=63820 RepID=A0A9W9TMX0_9EURO|nr:uncharacterized protein N7468_005357 [Penicillium chermesinum]KAJ5232401.1 hypothetical protein N7468_005357 [Penicillium chermesinum]